jgi:Caspase domain
MRSVICFALHHRRLALCYVVVLSVIFCTQLSHALDEDRGYQKVRVPNSQGQEIDLYKESHALLIGASQYAKGWPKLDGVKSDIEELAALLKKQGFQVVIVENPSHDQLIEAFTGFINRYGLNTDNRLLFFFSGHGYTVKQSYGSEVGYLVPVDAPNPDENFLEFMQKAVDVNQIDVFARRIQSRHALFIFDSCFSGSIFSVSRAMPKSISYKMARPVRQFITSGNADEEVPDKSVFLQFLISGISGEGDLNRDNYVTGTELGSYLQDNVVNFTNGAQHPQFGKIQCPYLNKGDFVFILDEDFRNSGYGNNTREHIEAWKLRVKRSKKKVEPIIVPLPSF